MQCFKQTTNSEGIIGSFGRFRDAVDVLSERKLLERYLEHMSWLAEELDARDCGRGRSTVFLYKHLPKIAERKE